MFLAWGWKLLILCGLGGAGLGVFGAVLGVVRGDVVRLFVFCLVG